MNNSSGPRTYGDRCGIARALDVVGERWALLVVRELVLGPKRFTDLRAGLPGIGPDILSQRLRELERAGLLRRASLPPPAASRVYELTERGRELEAVLLTLGRWGSRVPMPAEEVFGADSVALALRTLFSSAAAADLEAGYELRLGESVFSASVSDGALIVARGPAAQPDAVIETDPTTLAALLWHGAELGHTVRSGAAQVEGSRRLVRRFLRLFPQDPAH